MTDIPRPDEDSGRVVASLSAPRPEPPAGTAARLPCEALAAVPLGDSEIPSCDGVYVMTTPRRTAVSRFRFLPGRFRAAALLMAAAGTQAGCGREFYREWANQDVSEAVFEKSRDPRWRIDSSRSSRRPSATPTPTTRIVPPRRPTTTPPKRWGRSRNGPTTG